MVDPHLSPPSPQKNFFDRRLRYSNGAVSTLIQQSPTCTYILSTVAEYENLHLQHHPMSIFSLLGLFLQMTLGPYLVIISFSSSLFNYYDAGGRVLPLGHYFNTLMYRPCPNCLSFLLQHFLHQLILLFMIANCFSTVN